MRRDERIQRVRIDLERGELFFQHHDVRALLEEVDSLTPPQLPPQCWEQLKLAAKEPPRENPLWSVFLRWAKVKLGEQMYAVYWEAFLLALTTVGKAKQVEKLEDENRKLREEVRKLQQEVDARREPFEVH